VRTAPNQLCLRPTRQRVEAVRICDRHLLNAIFARRLRQIALRAEGRCEKNPHSEAEARMTSIVVTQTVLGTAKS
jgi:hypothetical protein